MHTPPISKLEVLAASLKIEPYKLLVNDDKDKSIINKMNSSRQYNQK